MDSSTKNSSVRRQAPWVVGCRIVGILTTLAGNILAARLLGPAEYGVYLFLSSVAACGNLVGAAGLSDAALRFSAESLGLSRRQLAVAYVRRTMRLCVVMTAVAIGLTAGGLPLFHFVTGRLSEPTLLVVLTVVALTSLAWQQLAGEILRGWNHLKLASLFSGGYTGGPISTLLFAVGITGLMLAQVSMTAAGVVGLLAASVCLTAPFALWYVWRVVYRDPDYPAEPAVALTASEDKQLLAMAGTVLVLHLLSFVCQQLDIWIGEASLSPADLGQYGVAKRSMLIAAMPVQMAMLTIIAAIPRLQAQGRRRELQDLMRGSAGIAAVPSLVALALLVLFPEPILQLLFGGSYSGAAPTIRILAVGHLVLVLVGNPYCMLYLVGCHRTVLPVNVFAAVIIAVGGPLAASRFGVAGLAWISAGSLIFQNALLWWLARRQSGIWTHVGLPRLKPAGEPSIVPQVAASPADKTTRLVKANAPAPPQILIEVVPEFSSQPKNV